MSNLVLEAEPLAIEVILTDEKLAIELADGRSIMVPLVKYNGTAGMVS